MTFIMYKFEGDSSGSVVGDWRLSIQIFYTAANCPVDIDIDFTNNYE